MGIRGSHHSSSRPIRHIVPEHDTAEVPSAVQSSMPVMELSGLLSADKTHECGDRDCVEGTYPPLRPHLNVQRAGYGYGAREKGRGNSRGPRLQAGVQTGVYTARGVWDRLQHHRPLAIHCVSIAALRRVRP